MNITPDTITDAAANREHLETVETHAPVALSDPLVEGADDPTATRIREATLAIPGVTAVIVRRETRFGWYLLDAETVGPCEAAKLLSEPIHVTDDGEVCRVGPMLAMALDASGA